MASDFRVPADWYESFFSSPANTFWEAMVPPAATRADIAFALRHLALEPTARILDVPCGSGRHTIELARLGFHPTGLDISDDAITRARAAAQKEGLEASFLRADMLDVVFDEPFDGIVCFGNSLGYFAPPLILVFLRRLAASLRSGGRLVLDTSVCAESVLPFEENRRYEFEGGSYDAQRLYDPMRSILKTRAQLALQGVVHELLYQHHVVTTGELVRLLEAAGFRTTGLFTDTEDTQFAPGCPRLLLAALRR